ncbi:hypothetical protein VP01_986g8 [Puccinia sorghi]|uniref:Uncharacterized protein n=1 Tax=Puccinia sorghi TaxID=27349 RepID=A0A0L6U623_9BASI|nr:hypothetical protein VP01_986g8 [Puccinia sorghi]
MRGFQNPPRSTHRQSWTQLLAKQHAKTTPHKCTQRHSLDPGQKKAPSLWEKDGKGGLSSICIFLEWLSVDGNYQWDSDNDSRTSDLLIKGHQLPKKHCIGGPPIYTQTSNLYVQTVSNPPVTADSTQPW